MFSEFMDPDVFCLDEEWDDIGFLNGYHQGGDDFDKYLGGTGYDIGTGNGWGDGTFSYGGGDGDGVGEGEDEDDICLMHVGDRTYYVF